MGFYQHKNAYLRDGWNWIDFIVVIVGIIEVIPGIPNLRALRTLRVLRPLKSIKAIPSMRLLILSLLRSLPALANVVLFLLFMFIMFGILGVQLFAGRLYPRCRFTPVPIYDNHWPIDEGIGRLCSADGSGLFTCPDERHCGHPEMYGIPLSSDNVSTSELINYGITTFDHMGVVLVTIFQVITLEGWVDMMYNLMDEGNPITAALFFCLLVLFGAFFLLNIILAVIMQSFDEINSKQTIEEDKHKHAQGGQQPKDGTHELQDQKKEEEKQANHSDGEVPREKSDEG